MSRTTQPDWQVRRASSDDAEAIAALINAHARHHYGEDRIGLDEVRTWFSSPGVQQDDTQSWWRRDGTLEAYAQVYAPEFPPVWDVLHDVTVHPNAAGNNALWDDIFAWCDRCQWKVRQQLRAPDMGICCGARILENDTDKRRQYESRGFQHVRNETLMRVGLEEVVPGDPEWPDGIGVRELDLETDMEGYTLAHGEAFRDHWGHVDLPLDERVRRKKAEFRSWGEMYVPSLWFVALDGDTIVGSVGSFVNYGNTGGRCYLYHVFVRRAWRNRRIATALLRTAFHALRQRGGRAVELHVDSDNMTYGLELYRGLGMRPVWSQRLYEKTMPISSRQPSSAPHCETQ
jgi:ribosomal protein S18 acetylase RimI-like enzyme